MYLKRNSKNQSDLGRLIFFLLILIASAAVFIFIPRLSIPCVIAYIFSLILRPVFPILAKWGLSRAKGFMLILLVTLITIILPSLKAYPLLKEQSVKAYEYIPKIEITLRSKIYNYQKKLREKYSINIQDQTVNKYFEVSKSYVTQAILDIPDFLGTFFEWLFLIPLFMYFMIAEGSNYRKMLLTTIPNKYFEKIYYLIHQFDKKIGGYIFAKSVEATLVGLIIGIGLAIVGFPFALLMGLAGGLTNIIPYLGPILGIIPAGLVFIVSPEYSSLLGPVLLVYLIANLIDMFLIFPVLVARIVNLHPLVVIVSVIIGSQIWGVVGMIISVPAANIIKLVFGEIYRELYPVDQKQ